MFELSEIGISQTQLIETGLNVAGFLAASGLSMLLYASIFNRRQQTVGSGVAVLDAAVSTKREGSLKESVQANFGPAANRNSVVGLSSPDQQRPELVVIDSANGASASRETSTENQYGRNRSEVIRLAREMLRAGNSAERVSDLLPVSESEMQLIQLSSGESQES